MKAGLVAAWLAGMSLVVWRNVHRDHHMPVPGALLGISGLFAAGALVADIWPRSAGLIAVREELGHELLDAGASAAFAGAASFRTRSLLT